MTPLHTGVCWGKPTSGAALLALRARPQDRDQAGLTAVRAAMPVDTDFVRNGGDQRQFKCKITNTGSLRVTVTRENFRKCLQILGEDSSGDNHPLVRENSLRMRASTV